MNRIKVLIVDDHTMFRQGVRSLLAKYKDIDIVGEAVNGRDAIESLLRNVCRTANCR